VAVDGYHAAAASGDAVSVSDLVSTSERALRGIALFEFAKGGLAVVVAAALASIGPEALQHHIAAILGRLGMHRPNAGPTLLDAITPHTVHISVAIATIYAGLRLLEGWGLWRRRAWASWLGAIGTAAYLPFELYTLWQHPAWVTWGVFLLNLAVVLLLVADIRRRRRAA